MNTVVFETETVLRLLNHPKLFTFSASDDIYLRLTSPLAVVIAKSHAILFDKSLRQSKLIKDCTDAIFSLVYKNEG